jgi:hypothetical protein
LEFCRISLTFSLVGTGNTVIFGKVVGQMGVENFLGQQVLFVQEEDDRRVLEPGVGDDGPEQGLGLLHSILQAN